MRGWRIRKAGPTGCLMGEVADVVVLSRNAGRATVGRYVVSLQSPPSFVSWFA